MKKAQELAPEISDGASEAPSFLLIVRSQLTELATDMAAAARGSVPCLGQPREHLLVDSGISQVIGCGPLICEALPV
jgi:hypothetical protein